MVSCSDLLQMPFPAGPQFVQALAISAISSDSSMALFVGQEVSSRGFPESSCPQEVNGVLFLCHFWSAWYWFSENYVLLQSAGAKLIIISYLDFWPLCFHFCLLWPTFHTVPRVIFLVRSPWPPAGRPSVILHCINYSLLL